MGKDQAERRQSAHGTSQGPIVGRPTTYTGSPFGTADHAPQTQRDASAQRQSLAQEFRSLASLHHPNVISALDCGFDEHQQPYTTMELIENAKSLRDFASGTNHPTS